MPKFLFIYRDPVDRKMDDMSPEEMQAQMNKWWTWLGKGQEEGWVVDAGDALTPEGRVIDKTKSISDGPHTESKELIGGYSMIQANDYAAACEHAMGCPIYEAGGSVEVREVANLSPPEN